MPSVKFKNPNFSFFYYGFNFFNLFSLFLLFSHNYAQSCIFHIGQKELIRYHFQNQLNGVLSAQKIQINL